MLRRQRTLSATQLSVRIFMGLYVRAWVGFFVQHETRNNTMHVQLYIHTPKGIKTCGGSVKEWLFGEQSRCARWRLSWRETSRTSSSHRARWTPAKGTLSSSREYSGGSFLAPHSSSLMPFQSLVFACQLRFILSVSHLCLQAQIHTLTRHETCGHVTGMPQH